jgi:3-oxoacyl-[acyl-carrier protein] reductase
VELGIKDRVALLTGASSGIGWACAEALLAEGARVVVTGSRQDRVDQAAERLGGGPDRVAGMVLDLTEPEHPARIVKAVAGNWGAPPTILVSSTGGPPPGTFDTLSDEQWERALDLVFRGFVRCIRALLPGMRAEGFGRILAITSTAAREAIDGLTSSTSLRAGVSGLVNALSREVGGEGITVNAVLPGFVATERLQELAELRATERGTTPQEIMKTFAAGAPLGRIIEPAELASVVAFLCSERAVAVNGSALAVDGGRLRSI